MVNFFLYISLNQLRLILKTIEWLIALIPLILILKKRMVNLFNPTEINIKLKKLKRLILYEKGRELF